MEIKSQVNTFEGGMDMDTDVSYMSNNTYRYAENVRLVTDTNGTNGILQNILYIKEYLNLEQLDDLIILHVIAALIPDDNGDLQNSAIVLTLSKADRDHNHIYIVSNFNLLNITCKCILKILWKITKNDDISMIYNYETSSVYKLYINTYRKGLNILNLHDLRDEWGDKPVEDNPNKYSTQVNVMMPKLEFNGFSSGSLPAGTYLYYYKLYTDTGIITTVSSGSELIYNAKANINSYSDSEGYVEDYPTSNSILLSVTFNNYSFTRYLAFRVRWKNNNDLPSIELFAEGDISQGTDIKLELTDGTGNVITTVTTEEFNDIIPFLFNAKTMYLFGNRLFFSNITSNSWDIPEDFDCRAYRCNNEGKILLKSANGNLTDTTISEILNGTTIIPIDHDAINPMNEEILYPEKNSADEYAYNNSGLYGGEGINISYTIVYGTTYEGATKRTNEAMSSTLAIYGLNRNGPTSPIKNNVQIRYLSGNNNYGNVELGSDLLISFCNPIVATKLSSYQRDETYRFGIVFYNSAGVSTPVHWIGDVRFPSGDTVGCEAFEIGVSEGNDLIAKPLGLSFNIKRFPEGAVAAEIVRCDRTSADRSIRAQGMLNNTVHFKRRDLNRGDYEVEYSLGSNDIRPLFVPTITNNNQHSASYTIDDSGVLTANVGHSNGNSWDVERNVKTFSSPEICINPDAENIIAGDFVIPIYNAVASVGLGSSSGITSTDGKIPYGYGITSSDGTLNTNDDEYAMVHDSSSIFAAIDHDSASAHMLLIKYYNLTSASQILELYSTKFNYNYNKNSVISQTYPVHVFYEQIDLFKVARRDIPFNTSEGGSDGYYKTVKGNYVDVIEGMSFTNTPVAGNKIGVGGIQGLIGMPLNDYLLLYVGYTGPLLLSPVSTLICNIKRQLIPYGGSDYYRRSSNIYISCGAYIKSTESNVIVFGGDTFLTNFCYQHCGMVTANDWQTNVDRNGYHNSVFVNIPIESTINTYFRSDEVPTKSFDLSNLTPSYYHTQVGTINTVSQVTAMYQYNSVYSVSSGGVNFAVGSTNTNISNTENNRYQIVCTEAKSAGEVLDSWAVSKFANTLNLDSKYGQVTKLIDFRDRLYALQLNALSVLSINERSLISDNSSSALVLGSGGILDRYDVIVSNYGTNVINDRSAISTFLSIYWYDNNKNVICSYGNDGFHLLSKEKKVLTFLNNIAQVNQVDAISIVNDKQNEVWMKFKGKLLVYNEHSGSFTSFYTHNPDWGLRFYDRLVTILNKRFYYTNTFGEEDVVKKLTSKITFVVNQDLHYTKVFDNLWFAGNIEDPNNDKPLVLSNINFNTKTQDSFTVHYNDVECREDTYRFPIPRQDRGDIGTGDEENQNVINRSYQPRMRGKYLLCNYEFNCDEDRSFEIPFIKTTYRYSML